MLSWYIMPLLLGYQFCSCWKRGRKSKVTQGVILMGPVMRVDRLRRGGGWALKRCCLQIGFLQVRHPRWVISPTERHFLIEWSVIKQMKCCGPNGKSLHFVMVCSQLSHPTLSFIPYVLPISPCYARARQSRIWSQSSLWSTQGTERIPSCNQCLLKRHIDLK